MHDQRETIRLRRELDDLADDFGRSDAPVSAGAPCLLVQTTTHTTYPTVAGVYYAVKPVTVGGDTETEGAAGGTVVGSAVFYALNLGGSIPPGATNVIATYIGNRWVFRFDA